MSTSVSFTSFDDDWLSPFTKGIIDKNKAANIASLTLFMLNKNLMVYILNDFVFQKKAQDWFHFRSHPLW